MTALFRNVARLALVVLVAATTGCSRDMSDLETYIDGVNARKGGRIEPLPQIKPYETFTYERTGDRSPFIPDRPVGPSVASGDSLRPDTERSREYLESFPLDSLAMVGTLEIKEELFALVQTTDTLIHRVQVGNYLGQADGRITSISTSGIDLIEIIPDGIGGYMERPATIALAK